ncbi:MAG TPA: DUF2934 domain-containing protein [Terriglobales bacterium]|nr:DUF2934 domain-containing protein [Terriglobales bacterium]
MKSRPISDSTVKENEQQNLPVEERIRRRAYELYEQRGRVDGNDVEDWLQAKEEVTGKSKTAAA